MNWNSFCAAKFMAGIKELVPVAFTSDFLKGPVGVALTREAVESLPLNLHINRESRQQALRNYVLYLGSIPALHDEAEGRAPPPLKRPIWINKALDTCYVKFEPAMQCNRRKHSTSYCFSGSIQVSSTSLRFLRSAMLISIRVTLVRFC
jgi:hypothetical protein